VAGTPVQDLLATLSGTVIRSRNVTAAEFKAGTAGGKPCTFTGTVRDNGSPAEIAHTASANVEAFDSGTPHSNRGATGAITLTLPPAAANLSFRFLRTAAYNLVIAADGSDTVNGAATYTMSANGLVTIRTNGTNWVLGQAPAIAGADQGAFTDGTGGTPGASLVASSSQGNIDDNFATVAKLLLKLRADLVTAGIIKGAA
jgi:hypothetical protein